MSKADELAERLEATYGHKDTDEAAAHLRALDANRLMLLDVCEAQHHAIDVLMARLIAFDPEFMPTSSRIWPAVVAGSEAIKQARAFL